MTLRNIGVFAHVDAGKTTVTEQLLYACGVISAPGSVDAGTAHTDALPVERRRGISVKASAAACVWRNARITLVDTPGHADFAAEVERALLAIDGAVLVVSAVEGVQAQTEIYYGALRKARIPTLVFINKCDRIGADRDRAAAQVSRALRTPAVPLWEETACMEAACEADDALLAQYLEGTGVSLEEARRALAGRVARGEILPALSGAALRGEGIAALLDAIVDLLPPPQGKAEGPLCGAVFAVRRDKSMGRAAQVRLFSGRLVNRQSVGEEKISQIRMLEGTRGVDAGQLAAGEIGTVYGLSGVKAGDILGDASLLPEGRLLSRLAQPLLSAKVLPEKEGELRALRAALNELSCEDTHLQAQWSPFTHELFVKLMGGVQTEVLQALLAERFGLACSFAPPTIVYKETIAKPSQGFVAYTMPKPCWAILHFDLQPLPPGSGVVYRCTVDPRKIPYRYRRQVEQTIPRALEQGMLGWEVTDIAITLFDGSDHPIHTHPLDFVLATPMGILDGLRRAGSVLMEPILSCRFTVPSACIGRVMSDLTAMRASFDAPEPLGEMTALTALVPAATSLAYPVKLAALTGGRGAMAASFHSYAPCPLELGATCERRGVSPLDTSKYILAARNALESDIW